VDFISFKTRLLLKDVGDDPIKRAELIDNILTSISVIPDSIKRAVYVQECSRLLEISEPDLLNKLNRIFRSRFQKQMSGGGQQISENQVAPSAPKQEPTPSEQEADALARTRTLERELLSLLVNHGGRTTKQIYYDQDGNPIDQVSSVCAYIVAEVQQDELSLSDPLYQELFSIFATALQSGTVPAVEDLMLSDNMPMRNLVADLAAGCYEVSKTWENKGICVRTVQTHDDKLNAAVFQAVSNFKIEKVNGMIEALNRQFKEVAKDDEVAIMELMSRKKQLDTLRNRLSALVRRVIC
ncbi:MAG: hypothetical protein K2H68_02685, partial [Bacteroidales bacterium]|nr:hypothetical protein [Bacteroidales bacterium]